MERGKKFYEAVFGFQFTPFALGPETMAFFPSAEDAFGASGALVKAEFYVPSHLGTMVSFWTEDIEGTLA